jgi:hypothetical protein
MRFPNANQVLDATQNVSAPGIVVSFQPVEIDGIDLLAGIVVNVAVDVE